MPKRLPSVRGRVREDSPEELAEEDREESTKRAEMEKPVDPKDAARAVAQWQAFERSVTKREAAAPYSPNSTGRLDFGRNESVLPAWVRIGPKPSLADAYNGTRASGRIGALAIHPTNPLIILTGSYGGIMRTADGGLTFTPVAQNLFTRDPHAITFANSNPNIVYAGVDPLVGGILKSTDAGMTWQKVSNATLPNGKVRRILVHPTDPNKLYVAQTYTHGFYRSTDGGVNWTRLFNAEVQDAEFHPDNPSRIYITTWSVAETYPSSATVRPSGSLFYTNDGGVTWIDGFTTPYDPTKGQMMLASVTSGQSGWVYTLIMGIPASGSQIAGQIVSFHPPDQFSSGFTYRQNVPAGSFNNFFQFTYDPVFEVDPSNSQVMYFGGYDMYKTVNQGVSWTTISDLKIHVDQHAMAWMPGQPATFLIGNDGGLFKTLDRGTNWQPLNDDLQLTEFYGYAVHPTDASISCGGTQDNGFQRRRNGNWDLLYGGDGGTCVFTTSNTIVFTYLGGDFLDVIPVDNSTFAQYKPFSPEDTARIGYFSPVVTDGVNSRLYLGTYRVLYSDNNGQTAVPLGSGIDLTRGGSDRVMSIGVQRGNPNGVFYTGSTQGRLMVTTNSGATWTDRSAGVPARLIWDILVDPTNPAIAYVGLDGYGSSHVLRTTNYGATWVALTGTGASNYGAPLVDAPVRDLAFDPLDRSTIYALTEFGAYRYVIGSTNWTDFNRGLGKATTGNPGAIATQPTGTIQLGTFGRGAYQLQRGTPCTVTPVNGNGFAGTLADGDCISPIQPSYSRADRYSFAGIAGQPVSITVSSGAIDAYAYLIAPDGTVIGEDDDGAGGLNSGIATTLPVSGTYTVEVSSNDINALGSYQLALGGAGVCTVNLSPALQTVAVTGGNYAVSVTASHGGCPWTLTATNAFFNFTSASSGTGNALVNYSVPANVWPSARNATISNGLSSTQVSQPGAVLASTSTTLYSITGVWSASAKTTPYSAPNTPMSILFFLPSPIVPNFTAPGRFDVGNVYVRQTLGSTVMTYTTTIAILNDILFLMNPDQLTFAAGVPLFTGPVTTPTPVEGNFVAYGTLSTPAGNSQYTGTMTVGGTGRASSLVVPGTGVGPAGGLLPDGAIDPGYLIATRPDGQTGTSSFVGIEALSPFPAWLANDANSKWIAPRPDPGFGNANGLYTYRTTVNLKGFDPATASIIGMWGSDNDATIKVNGVALANHSSQSFAALTPFVINKGLVAGTNTIDFLVDNAGGPTGLRVLTLGANAKVAAAVVPTVTVGTPNTLVNWGIGSKQPIKWSSTIGSAAAVNIDLSRDGGATWGRIATSVPNSGLYNWTVTGPATTLARIRVSGAEIPMSDISNVDFTIAAAFITVSAPNAATAKWGLGTQQLVSWTTNLGPTDNVSIALSTDGGVTFPQTLVADTPNDKSEVVNVPNSPTPSARVRVQWLANAAVTDKSDNNFPIAAPFVTVVKANGGEQWAALSSQTVTWASNLGSKENVRIELSTNGGVTWVDLGSAAAGLEDEGGVDSRLDLIGSTPSDGSQAVVMPNLSSATSRIRISWLDNPALSDTSDANFTVGAPFVTLTSPNGGESWAAATSRIVTWNSSLGGNVELSLSTNGGVTWVPLLATTPNDGSQAVTLPSVSSAQSRIRVRSLATGFTTMSDASNANFTIAAPFVSVLTPNGGESWAIASTPNVVWSSNLLGNVKVELSRDNGVTWTLLTGSTPNDGVLAWKVTSPATASARIRITSTSVLTATDASNAVFRIQ